MPDLTPPNEPAFPKHTRNPAPIAAREAVPGMAIDPPGAPEIDDAIWLRLEGTDRILTVSVADVAEHVSKDSQADLRARELGSTRYLQTGDIYMLPTLQATGAASLVEGAVRPTFSIEVPFSETGAVGSPRFFASTLRSRNLSYEQAALALADPEAPEHPTLSGLYHLARELSHLRAGRGALSVFNSKRALFTDEEGRVVRTNTQHFAAQFIVAECMIFANEAAANFLKKHEVPAFFRCQWAARQAQRVAMIQRLSQAVNVEVGALNNFEPAMLKRRLGYGFYDAEPLGHFSLATEAYCHITSPHRRFADLANNRILNALLRGEASPYARQEVDQICEELWNQSHEERLTRHAARHLAQRKSELSQFRSAVAAAAEGFLTSRGISGQVVRACAAATFPQAELAKLDAALDSGTAPQAAIALLIFMNAGRSPEARQLRERALRGIVEKPERGVEVLHSLKGLVPQLWVKPVAHREIAPEGVPPIFGARVSWNCGRARRQSKVWLSAGRKTALGMAAVELILGAAQRLDLLPELMEHEQRESQAVVAARLDVQQDRKLIAQHSQTRGKGLRRLEMLCERRGWGRPYCEIVALPGAEDQVPRFQIRLEVALRNKLLRHEVELNGLDRELLVDQACLSFRALLRHELKPRSAAGIEALGAARELAAFCRERYLASPKSKCSRADTGIACAVSVFIPGYGTVAAEEFGATRTIALGSSSSRVLAQLKKLLGAGLEPAWRALAEKSEERS